MLHPYRERNMSDIDKASPDQAGRALGDDELDAVTGGMFNAFANFGDIKGECTDAAPPAPFFFRMLQIV
jgi:hypothetical protein